MELWIPICIAAAFAQNLRSALQKHLNKKTSVIVAAYIRFLYAWPFAILYFWELSTTLTISLPEPNWPFTIYIMLGSMAQILFTVLLLWSFSFRNFAVGTTYSKTEVIQLVVLGALFLGDIPSTAAILAIIISTIGVMILSMGQAKLSLRNVLKGLQDRATVIGLTAGLCLALSSVGFRGAILALGHENTFVAAAYAMVCTLTLQVVAMGGYLWLRDRNQLRITFQVWRGASLVGLFGVLASIGWMTALAMQNAAYVRALGQVELIFSFIASYFFFREKMTSLEVKGIALVATGIITLLLVQ